MFHLNQRVKQTAGEHKIAFIKSTFNLTRSCVFSCWNVLFRSLRKDMHRSRPSQQPDSKKIKIDQLQAPVEKGKQVGEKMIELDLFSSDDEL